MPDRNLGCLHAPVSGDAAFPDGLVLKAGYSYLFSVGYHYDRFTITASDNFSWSEQDLGTDDAVDEAHSRESLDFRWWTNAYRTAAKTALGGGDFIPEFSISNRKEFITFIKRARIDFFNCIWQRHGIQIFTLSKRIFAN